MFKARPKSQTNLLTVIKKRLSAKGFILCQILSRDPSKNPTGKSKRTFAKNPESNGHGQARREEKKAKRKRERTERKGFFVFFSS